MCPVSAGQLTNNVSSDSAEPGGSTGRRVVVRGASVAGWISASLRCRHGFRPRFAGGTRGV